MKIFCVGRNYLKHAQELNNDVPEQPVIFMKPITALHPKRNYFFIPDFSNNIHYEAEIVIQVCKNGRSIEQQFAHKYYDAFSLGLDLTARDLQQNQKDKGLPWEIAKGFDFSAHLGQFMPINKIDINNVSFSLMQNDQVVQEGNTSHMIFNCDYLISYISKFFTLNMGDIIFTGTPAGVGKINAGDQLQGFIGQNKMFTLAIK